MDQVEIDVNIQFTSARLIEFSLKRCFRELARTCEWIHFNAVTFHGATICLRWGSWKKQVLDDFVDFYWTKADNV